MAGLLAWLALGGAWSQSIGAAGPWEGSVAWVATWEVEGATAHLLELDAAGPVGSRGWRLEGEAVLRLAGAGEERVPLEPVQEGRMAVEGPPVRLQLLVDRPHLSSGDPLKLISGSRRGDGEPGMTVEAAGARWELSAQAARRIDNPGPDGDLASLRLGRWWGPAHASLTLVHLEQGLLPWPGDGAGENGDGSGLLQQVAAVEGYLPVGSVEVGAEAALARPAGAGDLGPDPAPDGWAGLLRLRTLPWRPSVPLRLEAGLFETDPGFRSLAAREQPFPDGAAGGWAQAHLRFPGRRRLDVELRHARLREGGAEALAQVEGQAELAGLRWTGGVDASSRRTEGEAEAGTSGWLAAGRRGVWEVEARGGSRPARLAGWIRLQGGTELRAGAEASDGGTYRVELRQAVGGSSWRIIWKARSERDPPRYLFLEAEAALDGGAFLRARVGRWDRGRYDAVWGWPRQLELALGREF